MAIWWFLLVAIFWWFAVGLWWQTGGEQVEARAGGAAHGGGGLLRHLKTHPDIIIRISLLESCISFSDYFANIDDIKVISVIILPMVVVASSATLKPNLTSSFAFFPIDIPYHW